MFAPTPYGGSVKVSHLSLIANGSRSGMTSALIRESAVIASLCSRLPVDYLFKLSAALRDHGQLTDDGTRPEQSEAINTTAAIDEQSPLPIIAARD